MQAEFYAICEWLDQQLEGDEIYLANFHGEDSDFARFNQGKARQQGSVHQRVLELTLCRDQRQANASVQLSGDPGVDQERLGNLLARLREQHAVLPADPFWLINESPQSSETRNANCLTDGLNIAHGILEIAGDLDFVGILASGGLYRGFGNSLGQRNWHESYPFNLDWSVYHDADKAIKSRYAGFSWDPGEFAAKIAEQRARLEILRRPARTIDPGQYRVFLAPTAMEELTQMLTWGGFSRKEIHSKTSCLMPLWDGRRTFHPALSVHEDSAEGMAPTFQNEGFIKPERIPLINQGLPGEPLTSPRSAREFALATNGAEAEEAPVSIALDPGELPNDAVLAALDTGIYISNLWYLNFSDHNAARVTGMTRFATFWVENGRITAPLNVMRFDDSLFDLLGDQLEALTQEREFLPTTDTYDQRDHASARLPGALIRAMRLTL